MGPSKTNKREQKRSLENYVILMSILTTAILLSMALSGLHDDNNPFAMPLFILAVALIARLTSGYVYGVIASLVGTFCVNYMFTYPFWEFDITQAGYPLTFAMMLVVSISISTLTTQIKRQEHMRFEAEREKMHANLLRAIAHDLRTPLASILGASSALREQKLSAKDREALQDGIHRDARWLVRVMENLLSVTRFAGGGVTLKKSDEALEEIVGSAILKYRRATDALPIHVDMPERFLMVPMDAMLIEQVLINLFDNVSAHAQTATQIWLHVAYESDRVIVKVEDDGVGIPANRMPELFDGTFRQNEQSRPDERRSMGIGLSVCRTIVRVHGGDMKAGDSVHGGASISFSLPYTEVDNDQYDSQQDTDN